MPRRAGSYAARYREIQSQLIDEMGGVCRRCMAEEDLEFHHPKGKFWQSNRIGGIARLYRYFRDYVEGNLILLCGKCHDASPKKIYDEVPF